MVLQIWMNGLSLNQKKRATGTCAVGCIQAIDTCSDILSTPILDQVYNKNEINTVMQFNDFKASLAIIQTNNRLKLLEYEYAAKLNNKMNIEQRDRLEQEFLEKKKNALVPIYNLTFSKKEKFETIHSTLIEKVLIDYPICPNIVLLKHGAV